MRRSILVRSIIITVIMLAIGGIGWSQSKQIDWIGFEQLEDSLAIKPKKVFIDFYADWCAYCKKMDRVVFKDKDVIEELNKNYYCVKMDAESRDSISFGGKLFVNKQQGLSRNPTHEIPLKLGSRVDKAFTLPVVIILDENFQVEQRHFEYLSPKDMKLILKI